MAARKPPASWCTIAADRAAIRHLPLDAFRHELHLVLHVLLEVAVGRALRHRAERAHAAIALVGAALVEEHLARALVGAGEQRADHHAVRPAGDRLGEVARIFDAAVGDDRHAGRAPGLGRFQDGGELRHADAGDDAGGADRARPDADLDRVRAGVDQRLRALARRHIAGDDRDLVGRALDAADLLEHRLANGRARCRRRGSRRRPPSAVSARSKPLSPTVVAAATRRRPSASLAAFGWAVAFSMSLTVMRPTQRPRSSTTTSFSMRCWCRSRRASSWLTPSPTVTTLRVMSSVTGWRGSSAKRTSRLVRMPTSFAGLPSAPALDHRNAGDRGAPHERRARRRASRRERW